MNTQPPTPALYRLVPAPPLAGFTGPFTRLERVSLAGFLSTVGALLLLRLARRLSFRVEVLTSRLTVQRTVPPFVARRLPLWLAEAGPAEFIVVTGFAASVGTFIALCGSLDSAYPDAVCPSRAVGQVLAPVLGIVLLPVTRNSLFVLACGLPFERAVRLHIAASLAFLFLVVVHASQVVVENFAKINPHRELTLSGFMGCTASCKYGIGDGNLYGTLAAVLFTVLAIAACPSVRTRLWETFKFSHFVLFPMSVALAIAHARLVLPYVISPLSLWVLDVVFRTVLSARSRPCEATLLPGGSVVRLVTKPGWRGTPAPGAHALVSVTSPQAGEAYGSPLTAGMWHPFTVAACDPSTGELTFFVKAYKAKESWTRALAGVAAEHHRTGVPPPRNISTAPPPLRARLDGPYGGPPLRLDGYHQIVLVAGGTGFAPAAAVAQALLLRDGGETSGGGGTPKGSSGDVAAMAAAAAAASGSEAGFGGLGGGSIAGGVSASSVSPGRAAALLWTQRGPADPEAWLPGFLPRLRASHLFSNRVFVHVTPGIGERRDPAAPRLDVRGQVEAAVARAAECGHPPSRVAVLVCGPEGLVGAVRDAARTFGAHCHVDLAAAGAGAPAGKAAAEAAAAAAPAPDKKIPVDQLSALL